jgi:hypothetical protein
MEQYVTWSGSFVDTTENRTLLSKQRMVILSWRPIWNTFQVVWKLEVRFSWMLVTSGISKTEPDRWRAAFEWDRFIKNWPWYGFGARFDFSSSCCVSISAEARDPALPENSRWIPVFGDFNLSDLGFKFGIGYPF